MNLVVVGLGCMWGVALGGIAWYVAGAAQQMTYVTLSDGRQRERHVPLLFRLLLPFAPSLGNIFRQQAFARHRDRLDRKITAAGYEGILSAVEILSLRLLLPLAGGMLWIGFLLLAMRAWQGTFIENFDIPLCIIGVLWLYLYPTFWLRTTIAARHRSIRRSLPFVLDILTLSVEAGLDFMTALQRHVERANLDELGEELIRVVREIQIGKTRRDALRDMSKRVDFVDLRSVVNALVQADELGVSIGSILRIQAEQIRQRRFERAEKQANEAPVKMLFPLMFFIFPAVFLILLGPILVRLMEQGF